MQYGDVWTFFSAGFSNLILSPLPSINLDQQHLKIVSNLAKVPESPATRLIKVDAKPMLLRPILAAIPVWFSGRMRSKVSAVSNTLVSRTGARLGP